MRSFDILALALMLHHCRSFFFSTTHCHFIPFDPKQRPSLRANAAPT